MFFKLATVLFGVSIVVVPISSRSLQGELCMLGNVQGVCKHLSECWIANPSVAHNSCNFGKVCCTAESENQRCEQINSRVALPNPGDGCCGLEMNDNLDDDRITNGKESGPFKFPWLVRIMSKNSNTSKCSGVLIGARHVITARHCLTDVYSIRLGCSKNCSLELKSDSLSRVYHSENNLDFSILELVKPVPYTDLIRPICLTDWNIATEGKEGLELLVAGWGRTQPDRRGGSSAKLYTLVPYVPRAICNEKLQAYRPGLSVPDNYVCAGGDSTGRDACKGDSGGPLMRKTEGRHEVVGVVRSQLTFGGVVCGKAGLPSGYIDVHSQLDWIRRETSKAVI